MHVFSSEPKFHRLRNCPTKILEQSKVLPIRADIILTISAVLLQTLFYILFQFAQFKHGSFDYHLKKAEEQNGKHVVKRSLALDNKVSTSFDRGNAIIIIISKSPFYSLIILMFNEC